MVGRVRFTACGNVVFSNDAKCLEHVELYIYKKCTLRKEITSGRKKGLTSNIENVRRVTSHKDRDSV